MALTTKPVLPFVEIMATQVCNISCHGCTNYSDLTHQGYLTWEQAREQIEPWTNRVEILDFGIIGGEPLINPEIRTWIKGVRELLPNAHLRFTTNGILLDKHFDIVQLLADIGNCVLKISAHTTDIESTINRVFEAYNWQPIYVYGIHHYKTTNDFRFQVRRPETFIKTYQNNYENMQPHNSDPASAFEICCQQTCPLLYQGQIYKCSTSGLLQSTLAKFNWPNRNAWEPYLLPGLSPDCSESELLEFLDNFGKPAEICRQCPTQSDTMSKIDHVKFVQTKKNTK